ncbi:MAG: ABC-type multidrug transport system ATPase subunit [Flavobacteriales bacterium]|jgi:ABC-type multidrug transport system ATPase subunit
MSSSIVLETTNLTKHYGNLKAVSDMNLSIKEGSVFGILGPNGSGKSTTLGMALGVTKPTSGSFKWFGGETDHQVRKQIGAILERPIFYPAFTAEENLRITAQIKQVDRSRIDDVLKLVGLYDRRSSKFKTYSLGMKQRLAIGSAMISDPKVLILDEPTNGLDPQGIAEIRGIILDIAKRGKTIVLASHLLDEVQKVCNEFCVLRNGKLIFQGAVSETGNSAQQEVEFGTANGNGLDFAKELDFVEVIEVLNSGAIRAHLDSGFSAEKLNEIAHSKGLILNHLVSRNQTLEEKFLEILKNDETLKS